MQSLAQRRRRSLQEAQGEFPPIVKKVGAKKKNIWLEKEGLAY